MTLLGIYIRDKYIYLHQNICMYIYSSFINSPKMETTCQHENMRKHYSICLQLSTIPQ